MRIYKYPSLNCKSLEAIVAANDILKEVFFGALMYNVENSHILKKEVTQIIVFEDG